MVVWCGVVLGVQKEEEMQDDQQQKKEIGDVETHRIRETGANGRE